MTAMRWLSDWISRRGRSLSLYRSGMAKARKRDFAGAIVDYSTAIDLPNIPNGLKAMVIYNRALAYSAVHEDHKAAEDLLTVLQTPGVSRDITAAARERQERLRRRQHPAQPSGPMLTG